MQDLMDIIRGQGRRLDRAEVELAALRDQVARLEGRRVERPAAAPGPPRPAVPAAPAPPPQPAAPPTPWPLPPRAGAPRQRLDLEELLGGRVLGLAGALAVLLGVAFLVAMAVERGWIDEPTRIAIGFAGCSTLLAVAVWLYERRGRTQAALAAAGSAIAGLFSTLTAGAQLYDLFSDPVSLTIAGSIGAAALALGLRWSSRTFAALGLLGALLAPWLVGAQQSGLTMTFLLLVLSVAVAVGSFRRWEWLAPAASVMAGPQVVEWLVSRPEPGAALLVLAGFWIANVVASAGIELRVEGAKPRPASVTLLLGSGLLAVAGGYDALDAAGHGDLANAWMGVMAGAHLALGLAGARSAAISRNLAHLLLAGSLVLADITLVLVLDGPALAIVWAVSAACLAALTRVFPADSTRLQVAAGTQLALAAVHVVAVDATPDELWGPQSDVAGSLGALGVLGLSALAAAQLVARESEARTMFGALAVAVLAYLTAFVLDGSALVVAWSAEAVGVMALARLGERDEDVDSMGAAGAVTLLTLAGIHTVAIEALPRALVYGVDDMAGATVALAAVSGAALAISLLIPRSASDERLALAAVSATALVYLGSVAIVTAFQPSSDGIESSIGLLDERQQGQLLLSAFWAVTGLGALLTGLRLRRGAVRAGGFVLLGIATTKVFLFDLSALESLYRVGSFVALGLLLLGAAFAWQRARRNDVDFCG